MLPPCGGRARVLPHGKPGVQFGEWPEAFGLPVAPFAVRPGASDPAAGRRPERQAPTGAGTPRESVAVERPGADIPAVLETFQPQPNAGNGAGKHREPAGSRPGQFPNLVLSVYRGSFAVNFHPMKSDFIGI